MEILSKLNDLNVETLEAQLNELDNYIKQNETFRTHTPEIFYKISLDKFKNLFSIETINWKLLRLVVKCVKNSAAAFKTEFSNSESELSDYLTTTLINNLNDEIFTKFTNNNEDKSQFYLSIFQYIFNLIQGNKPACDIHLEKWIHLSFSLLTKLNLKQEFYDVTSMIIIYSCKQKFKNEGLLENLSQQLSPSTFLHLIENLEENFQNKPLEQKFSNWTFKFLDHYFDFMYSNHLVECTNFDTMSHSIRYFLIYHIMDRLMDSKDVSIQKCYFSPKSLEFLCRFFSTSTQELLVLFDKIETTSLYLIINSLKEVKLLTNILSDLLTMEETRLFGNRFMVAYIQDQIELYKATCKLFKEIHVNKEYLDLVKKYSKNSAYSEWFTLKCDLVRLIGILVYENEQNQNYLVNDDLLHIISSNLNLDVDNPFVREWSIVALKHILANLDKK